MENSATPPQRRRSMALPPLLIGLVILIIMVYILLNELFWSPPTPLTLAELPTQLWLVLLPGFVMIGVVFSLGIYRLVHN